MVFSFSVFFPTSVFVKDASNLFLSILFFIGFLGGKGGLGSFSVLLSPVHCCLEEIKSKCVN